MRQILLFGTSGNPPTGRDGHSGIVDYFVTLGVCPRPTDELAVSQSASDQVRAPALAEVLLLVVCCCWWVVAGSCVASLLLCVERRHVLTSTWTASYPAI